jgi:drug/metabolite transporter (DMT)-like permease
MAVGAAALPSGWVGLGGLLILGVVIPAPTLMLFNYGAERLPAAAPGVLTAAIPAFSYLFALLLGKPFDAITALGGAVALVGVAMASVTAPSTDSSPAGSDLPPHEDVAAGPFERD